MGTKIAVFDKVASEFKGEFTKQELFEKLLSSPDWKEKNKYYKGNCLKDRMKSGKITKLENGKYKYNETIKPTKNKPKNNVSKKKEIELNEDLPKEVTRKNKIVDITQNNAKIIHDFVANHPSYSYTVAIEDAYKNTKPANPNEINKNAVITRLIIINQIDGVSLNQNFGSGAFSMLAESIVNAKIEEKIANKEVIPNNLFKKIARWNTIDGEKSLTFFSAISKYIARTAHYCYNNDDGYPIYDKVLKKHLHLYIDGLIESKVKAIVDECDYEKYCKVINDYLTNINKRLPEDKKISNLMFDQIV